MGTRHGNGLKASEATSHQHWSRWFTRLWRLLVSTRLGRLFLRPESSKRSCRLTLITASTSGAIARSGRFSSSSPPGSGSTPAAERLSTHSKHRWHRLLWVSSRGADSVRLNLPSTSKLFRRLHCGIFGNWQLPQETNVSRRIYSGSWHESNNSYLGVESQICLLYEFELRNLPSRRCKQPRRVRVFVWSTFLLTVCLSFFREHRVSVDCRPPRLHPSDLGHHLASTLRPSYQKVALQHLGVGAQAVSRHRNRARGCVIGARHILSRLVHHYALGVLQSQRHGGNWKFLRLASVLLVLKLGPASGARHRHRPLLPCDLRLNHLVERLKGAPSPTDINNPHAVCVLSAAAQGVPLPLANPSDVPLRHHELSVELEPNEVDVDHLGSRYRDFCR